MLLSSYGSSPPSLTDFLPISERPDTPVLEPSSTPESDRAAAAILIQRLLRGRAAQNSMYDGKMRRQALIEELKLGDSGAGECS